MTSPKRIINVAILVFAFCVQSILCRADDLQATMHALVERYPFGNTKGTQWEADKQTLAGYSPEQLVRALIVELDLDRGLEVREESINNPDRDLAVYRLFRALDLPPTLICQELGKPSSPERKVSLMFVLRHSNKPEVVRALLRQLGDRRTVTMPKMNMDAGIKPHQLRVCDVAFSSLIDNVDVPNLRRPGVGYRDKLKDEMIQEGLTKLKLVPP